MNYSHALLINVDTQLKDTHENAIDEDAKDDDTSDVINEDATVDSTKLQDTIFVSYIRKRKPKNNLAKPNQSSKSEHEDLHSSEQSEESSKSTNDDVKDLGIESSMNDDLSNAAEKPSISPHKSSQSNHHKKVQELIRFYSF